MWISRILLNVRKSSLTILGGSSKTSLDVGGFCRIAIFDFVNDLSLASPASEPNNSYMRL
jgi:hypothetical protein